MSATDNQKPTAEARCEAVLDCTDLLAELVFYGAHNYGNYALCGRCGKMCGRCGCVTCDESGKVDGEPCENCLDGEQFWCDDCGEITGWLPKGQYAPRPSANDPHQATASDGRPQT